LTDDLGKDLINELLALMVQYSPNDPVAGNPSSMMANFVRSDFSATLEGLPLGDSSGGTTTNLSSSVSAGSPDVTNGNEGGEEAEENEGGGSNVGVGLGVGSYEQGESKVDTLMLPLSYSWDFDGESKPSLTLRLPISQIDVDGNKGFAAGIGLTYRQYLSPSWQMLPSLNYGVTASEGLGSGGAMASYSLLSIYDLKVPWGVVRFGNQAGQYRSVPLSVGGTIYDAGIESTVLRNGLIFQFPVELEFIREGATFDPYILDTRYFGTKLYIMQYYEIGFTLSNWIPLASSLTLNYLIAEENKAKGISFLFRAQF
jgi:hypothetical protein